MPMGAELSWEELVTALRSQSKASKARRGRKKSNRFRGVSRHAGDHAYPIALHVAGSDSVLVIQGASEGTLKIKFEIKKKSRI